MGQLDARQDEMHHRVSQNLRSRVTRRSETVGVGGGEVELHRSPRPARGQTGMQVVHLNEVAHEVEGNLRHGLAVERASQASDPGGAVAVGQTAHPGGVEPREITDVRPRVPQPPELDSPFSHNLVQPSHQELCLGTRYLIGGDPGRQPDLPRRELVAECSRLELPVLVSSPAEDRSVAAQGASMGPHGQRPGTDAYVHGVGDARQLHRSRPVPGGAVTDLAHVVLSPARHLAVVVEHAVCAVAYCDLHRVAYARDSL